MTSNHTTQKSVASPLSLWIHSTLLEGTKDESGKVANIMALILPIAEGQ